MTQEQKHLLLVDLSARLPYQPICEFTDTEDDFCTATAALGYSLRDFIAGKVLIKPYLRPMSSMTEEEKNVFHKIVMKFNEYELFYYNLQNRNFYEYLFTYTSELLDWLNAHHIDYRGLIPRGLALEAPENMYSI